MLALIKADADKAFFDSGTHVTFDDEDMVFVTERDTWTGECHQQKYTIPSSHDLGTAGRGSSTQVIMNTRWSAEESSCKGVSCIVAQFAHEANQTWRMPRARGVMPRILQGSCGDPLSKYFALGFQDVNRPIRDFQFLPFLSFVNMAEKVYTTYNDVSHSSVILRGRRVHWVRSRLIRRIFRSTNSVRRLRLAFSMIFSPISWSLLAAVAMFQHESWGTLHRQMGATMAASNPEFHT